MKPKIFDRKLTLNRETIADLSEGNMGKVKAGAAGTYTAPPRCWSDEAGCTYGYTCNAECTYLYSKNGKVC